MKRRPVQSWKLRCARSADRSDFRFVLNRTRSPHHFRRLPNQKQLRQIRVETTVVSMKGEEVTRSEAMLLGGPDGNEAAPERRHTGAGAGRLARNQEKEEIMATETGGGLVHYMPPDSQRIRQRPPAISR
jgi:hypothetical protein